jgi:quinolinate synthase
MDVVSNISSDTVLFGPDRHLAEYIAKKTGKIVIPVPEDCYCPVHVKFNPNEIKVLKSIYKDHVFIAHPECPASVRALADFVGSTSQMIKFVKSCPNTRFLVGTEVGIIYRMVKECVGKSFVPASTSAICEDMKKITLEKLLQSLRNKLYRVEVDKEVAIKVRKALKNTFDVLGVESPWSKK